MSSHHSSRSRDRRREDRSGRDDRKRDDDRVREDRRRDERKEYSDRHERREHSERHRGRSDRDRDHEPRSSRRKTSRSRSRSPLNRRKKNERESPEISKVGAMNPQLLERPEITEKDLEGKTEEEQEMMKMMGFGGFETTKGKPVIGNDVSAVNILQKRKYRQYMNRKGGFNRPLDFVA